jgi:hypothetical protein
MRDSYYDIKSGLYGLLCWAKFAWKWRPWDYEYGLLAIEHHLKALEKSLRNGNKQDSEKCADEVKTALKLLDGYLRGRYDTSSINDEFELKQKYLSKFFNLMTRKMEGWWD